MIDKIVSNSEVITHHSVFRIGVVNSVNGRSVQVLVDRDKNTSHLLYKGKLIKNVAVGSYVKILKGFETIIGQVESEYIEHNREKVIKIGPRPGDRYTSEEDKISRILNLKLIGHLNGDEYSRGITDLPLIDNECHLLTDSEFVKIHSFAQAGEKLVEIGTLAADPLVPIKLGVKKLFASHIGIFGNTGSGKSYTLAKLYRQFFLAYKGNDKFKQKAHFLFYDFNGEYSTPKAIVEGKKVYNLSTSKGNGDKIPLSDNDMLDEDLLSIFANATEKTQRPFIVRCIRLFKRINKDTSEFQRRLKVQIHDILMMSDKVKGDTLIDYVESILPPKMTDGVYRGLRLDFAFQNKYGYYFAKSGGTNHNLQENPELINGLQIYQQVDQFQFSSNFIENFIDIMYMQLIYDVLDNRAMNEHIAPAINKLKSNEKNIVKVFSFGNNNNNVDSFWNESNIVIINLNDVNTDTKKLIPLLLTKKLYAEYKKKHAREENDEYLNIVVDEAHNILSYQSNRESEEWKDYRLEVFEEIIKEGRKFGVFMTIASQRPYDISPTIISQLHNYFIHRLVNDKDIEQINNTISYLDKVSVESLPILATGVCVVAGIMTEMPVVVQISKIEDENKPMNDTIDLIKAWG